MHEVCLWYYINLLTPNGKTLKWYEANYGASHYKHFYWSKSGGWDRLRSAEEHIKKRIV